MFMYLYHNLHKILQDDLFGIRGCHELGRSLISKILKISGDQSCMGNLLVHICHSTQMVCAGCLLKKMGKVVIRTEEMVEVEVVGGMVEAAIW